MAGPLRSHNSDKPGENPKSLVGVILAHDPRPTTVQGPQIHRKAKLLNRSLGQGFKLKLGRTVSSTCLLKRRTSHNKRCQTQDR